MAEVKISDMTPYAGPATGLELFEISADIATVWTTFSMTLDDIVDFVRDEADDTFVLRNGDEIPGGLTIQGTVLSTTSEGIQLRGSNASGSNIVVIRSNANAAYNGVRSSADEQGINNSYDKTRGTLSSPADVVTNDWALRFTASYYGGGNTRSSGRLQHTVIEPTPGVGTMGGRWSIICAPLGSTSLATDTVRIEHDTGLSMYGANPVIDQDRLHRLRPYTVASLPTAGTAGRSAYATNLRVFNGAGTQEGAGTGTGGAVHDNGTNWKIAGTNVTAIG